MLRLKLLLNLIVFTSILPCTFVGSCAADEFTAAQIEFFETRIRPVLVKHCLECHGPNKPESDLRLDSREAILQGGASGEPAVVLGQPKQSLLIQSILHSGDYDMPPTGKIGESKAADLASWVEMKLPWPASNQPIAALKMPELIQQHRSSHWSFQPIQPPTVPDAATGSTPLDKFVIEKLAKHSLELSPRADRRTLIRRVSFDLLGLPPNYDSVQAFVDDDSPDAYSQMIDRMLGSPQYGERWARHWLDVARYADTSGYTLAEKDNSYPFAYTYRDYVIDAFNADLPYDQFIREQLAADYLEIPQDKKTLAALGFITVGRKYLAHQDTIDDQIDVVTRGLMGLTVSCARCHDHKYDAVPTEDYYSLYSVFANNHIPQNLPLIGDPAKIASVNDNLDKRKKLVKRAEAFRKTKHQELLNHVHQNLSDYLVRVIASDQKLNFADQEFIKLKDSEIRKPVLDRWRNYLAGKKGQPTILAPATQLVNLPAEGFEKAAAKLISTWSTTPEKINPVFLKLLESSPPKSKLEVANLLSQLFDGVLSSWKAQGSKPLAIGQFQGAEREIAVIVFSSGSPANLAIDKSDRYLTKQDSQELARLREPIKQLNTQSANDEVRAMVLRDNDKLHDERIMIRGNIDRRGEIAPRRFVALLSQPDQPARPLFQHKSGRLELAEKIASPDNPLTARVIVNRVWMHHFGIPIVDTPSDFGIRCEEPIHRPLLDHLASEFMKNDWSIKQLHQTIMLSDAYCQQSNNRATGHQADPENRLLWKMNRRRLEFEPLRDSILAVTQQLDQTMHGPAIELFANTLSNRRTIYGRIDRQDLPGLYRVFDLASPDQSAAKRTRTSVPQQSMFMLNSKFILQQAKHLVTAAQYSANATPDQKIRKLYQTVFQRQPSTREIEIGTDYIRNSPPNPEAKNLSPWERYAQILLCSNEFEFID
jgi:mono/diheme cytochrome c family protein